ncbi:hypothetical protein HMPREF1548_06767 [Clostridium sp. KLE 1755]|jgi:hypothetical protein|nr:hypothetical protein HMPREF1548_06767 [Clostridium sp. KLE 1755]
MAGRAELPQRWFYCGYLWNGAVAAEINIFVINEIINRLE